MKRIVFGITGLTVGGAERVLIDLANRLCDEYDITIFTIYGRGSLMYQLDPKVKVISLFKYIFEDYFFIQRILISLKLLFGIKPPNGYDTMIAFLEGPITRLFAKDKTTKKLAWIHVDISEAFGKGKLAKLKLKIDQKLYKKYDKVVFVSEENRDDFNNTCGKMKNEVVVRNYLDYKKIIEKAEEKEDLPFNKDEINLVTACRLTNQKAIDRFARVHSWLERDGYHSKVYIVGDGPKRLDLQKYIDSLGITNSFYLLGEKTNPYPFMKAADYFCLLSYYEGYGMVLDEAKILGKNIVITDTASRESIEKYSKAIIADNSDEGIYSTLKEVIAKGKPEETKKEKYDTSFYEDIITKVKTIL